MNSDALTLESFKRSGFDALTEIQKKAFPVVNRRGNCLLVAPTGSGKTEAAVIPVFSLMSQADSSTGSIRAIYVIEQRCVPQDN